MSLRQLLIAVSVVSIWCGAARWMWVHADCANHPSYRFGQDLFMCFFTPVMAAAVIAAVVGVVVLATFGIDCLIDHMQGKTTDKK